MSGASPHCGRQTPSIPLPFLEGFGLKTTVDFPRPQQVSQEASTPPQHSDESKQDVSAPTQGCHLSHRIKHLLHTKHKELNVGTD